MPHARGLLALSLVLASCGDGDAPESPITPGDGRWACPPDWAAHPRGGCAPTADPTGWHTPGDEGGPPGESWLPPGTGATAADWDPGAGITSCAAGWTRDADGLCDPALDACPDSAPVPGGGCVPVREADCPASEWPDVSAESGGARLIHVRAGAPDAGADGTTARPYPTLTRALAAAGPGEWVLVAAGEYEESLTFDRDVHLAGVCAARVGVRNTVLEVTAGNVEVRGITLLGGSAGPATVSGARVTGGALALREVAIRDQTGSAVIAAGGTVTLEDSLVTGCGSALEGASLAVRADPGSSLVIRRSALVDNEPGPGATDPTEPATVRVEGIGALTIEGSLVRGRARSLVVGGGEAVVTESLLDDGAPLSVIIARAGRLVVARSAIRSGGGPGGNALAVYGAGSVEIAATSIERSSGLQANEPETTLAIADSVVRGPPGGELLYGVVVTGGARATVSRTRIERAVRNAAYAVDAGTTLDLDGVVVLGTDAAPTGELFGPCVVSAGQARVSLRRSLLDGCHRIGALSTNRGALVVDGSVIRGTYADAVDAPDTPADESTLGHGVQVNCASSVEVRHSVLYDGEGAGVLAAGLLSDPTCLLADATATIEDSVILATRPHVTGTHAGAGGFGIQAHSAGRVHGRRVLVARSTDAGVFALDRETAVDLEDVVVDATAARADGASGRGLFVTTGARITADRTLVRASREAGAIAIAARLVLRDSAVIDVSPRPDGAYGVGIAAGLGSGAHATLERVLVERVHEAGLLFVTAGAEVSDVVVRDVTASPRGFGIGLGAAGGGTVSLTRVAISRVTGAGIASTPFELADPPAPLPAIPPTAGTLVMGEDVLVEDVRSSTVAFETVSVDGTPTIRPTGTAVAYGLAVSPSCAMSLARVALHGGGYGFHDASGTLTLRDVAITGQLDAVGATTGSAEIVVERLFSEGNALEGVVEDSALPEAATLPPPTDLEL